LYALKWFLHFTEKKSANLNLKTSVKQAGLEIPAERLLQELENWDLKQDVVPLSEAEEIEHVTPKYLLSQIDKKYPLIALIDPAVLYGGVEGFGHFVVITGIENDKIYYHDPDLDKDLTRNISDFMKAWEKFSFKGVRIWKSLKR